jgi:hypothetical protein
LFLIQVGEKLILIRGAAEHIGRLKFDALMSNILTRRQRMSAAIDVHSLATFAVRRKINLFLWLARRPWAGMNRIL